MSRTGHAPSLTYAIVERERRWLLRGLPDDVPGLPATGADRLEIRDRYVEGSRLRLREVRTRGVDPVGDERVQRKLGHKVRLDPTSPYEVACTSLYLDDAEWALLADLPARCLDKTRHRLVPGGARGTVAVDVVRRVDGAGGLHRSRPVAVGPLM